MLTITGSNFPRAKALAKINLDTWNISAIIFDEDSQLKQKWLIFVDLFVGPTSCNSCK